MDVANVNNPIVTQRLTLRAITPRDYKTFAYHYKYDGDFELFTGRKPSQKTIKEYAGRRAPCFFAIEENQTHNLIGYIGLSLHPESMTGLLEYYIFKPFRKKRFGCLSKGMR